MKLAILGTRGIPANYGGFETFAEELATRLVTRGHDVSVYCRPHYVSATLETYKGVKLVNLPTIRHKYLDTVVHTMVSAAHAMGGGYDVVLVCNAANAIFCPWPRLTGTKIALNVDGLERKRKKWNAFGRAWYLASERLSTWFPNAIVTDAKRDQAVLRRALRREIHLHPVWLSRSDATPAAPRSIGSASNPTATFSTSAAWSPKTTRTP